MKLKYWIGFSKRKNSTKIPSGSGTEIDVYLKEDTSIDNPSIVLKGNATNIDYAYIAAFNKYYFVGSPIMLTNGTTQYDLEEDILATHKTEVGSTIAHIVYSSTGYDNYIVDPRIAVKPTKAYMDTNVGASGLDTTGVYIASVVNEDANGDTGAITYYYIPYNYLDNLCSDLLDDNVWDAIKNKINNPLESFISLIWVPIPYTALVSGVNIDASASYIKLMRTTLPNTQGYKIKNPIANLGNVSISIPFRHDDFRDSQPYTNLSIELPGLGLTDLNANDFIESTNVNIYTYIDVAHGDLTYWINDDDGNVVKTSSFHCGVSVPIAHSTTNATGGIASIGGTVGGVVSLAAGIASGNPLATIGGAVTSVLSAGNTALQFNSRSTSIRGADVGRSAFEHTTFVLLESVVDTEDPDDANYIAVFGRPVGLTQAISNHSGYVQCENASIDIAGDNYERDSINSYLNSGFYYE